MRWTARFSKEYCWLLVDTPEELKTSGFELKDYPNLQIFNRSIKFLRSRGWKITRDLDVYKNFRLIKKFHRYGKKGDLELGIEIKPAVVEFNFYQNIVFENKSGGKYDFDKYTKMPYLVKLMFLNECNKLSDYLGREFGCVTKSTDLPVISDTRIIASHNSRSFTRGELKSLEEIPLKHMSEYDFECNSTDRDGKRIECGQVKYFRHWNGRLYRGKVWHNINNMWSVIINKYDYNNIASFKLFDPTKEDLKYRRIKPVKLPEEYKEKLEAFKKLSTKELVKELKRRERYQNNGKNKD